MGGFCLVVELARGESSTKEASPSSDYLNIPSDSYKSPQYNDGSFSNSLEQPVNNKFVIVSCVTLLFLNAHFI